jgi:phenylpropionate dioxygenase-like ring-hydroxylating dioxygenase large terminal subunit
MAFVKNNWYVAAWSRELKGTPVARTILGESVVLFRSVDGAAVALEDRCPHRLLPLSAGRIINGDLQCGYHGLTFDGTGRCVGAPTQDSLPPNASVRNFPVAERLGLVWIWMGAPLSADPDNIYDLPEYHQSEWGAAEGDALFFEANYLLLCDNLCDPTHVTYVHPTTLGSPDVPDTPVTFQQQDWGVSTTRWTPDSEPVGFFKIFGSFEGNVDRWQHYDMHVPTTAIINFGSAATGTGAEGGGGDGRIQVYACHFMTPETERTTFDYWLHVRNFAPDNASVGEGISDQFRIAFNEDKEILKHVQIEEERAADIKRVGLDLDASAGLFRRMVSQRIRAEERQ